MGNQSFVIVVLGTILLTMTIVNFSSVWVKSTQTASSEIEVQQALNVASSGVNMALSRLRQNRAWRTGFSDLSIANGECDVTVVDCGTDSIRITSTGRCGDVEHTSSLIVCFTPIIPAVTGAVTIYGDSVAFDNSGKSFAIDGRDHRIDGSLSGGTALNGISVEETHSERSVEAKLIKGKVGSNVTGSGSAPSVGTVTLTSLLSLRDQLRAMATVNLPAGHTSGNAVYGSMAAPVIAYIPGDARWTGNITGYGILVIDGNLEMGGNCEWHGLVVSVSHDRDAYLGGSGTPLIIGAAIVGNDETNGITNLHVNGTPDFLYSAATLSTIYDNLNMMDIAVSSYWE